MISDLSLFLAVEHVKRLADPSVPAEEADQDRQLFEAALSASQDASAQLPVTETYILRHYLRLRSLTDLESLPPQVHVWLLERLCIRPEAMSSEDVITLHNVYFLSPHPIRRSLVVNTLVILDGLSNRQRSYVETIWENILQDEDLPEDEKTYDIEELTDMLLDFWSPEAPAERALELLLRRERISSLAERLPAMSRIRQRAERLGGRDEQHLRRLLERG
jgi:hypothetical protein